MFASVSLPRPRKREKIPSSFAVSDSNTRYPYLVLDAHEVDEKCRYNIRTLWGSLRRFVKQGHCLLTLAHIAVPSKSSRYSSVSSGPRRGEKGVRAWMSGCLSSFPAVMG